MDEHALPEPPATESRKLVSRGLAAEQAGDVDEADRCFAQVARLGVPLPGLLMECGRYFKRRGDLDRAFVFFSRAQPVIPGAMAQFFSGMPAEAMARYLPWATATMLHAPRPAFYGFQPVKQALRAWLGTPGAAAALAPTFATGPLQLRELELASLRRVALESGIGYLELAPGRETFFQAPTVLGAASDRKGFTATTRAFFRCQLPDAIVSSKSNFVIAAGKAVLDFQGDELLRCPLDLDVDPVVVAADDDRVHALVPPEDAALAGFEDAIALVGVHSYAFGHWLLEFLPKFWAWRDQPGFAEVPVLVDEQMPVQHLEALETFLLPGQRVVVLAPGERVRVARLWTTSMPIYMPLGPKPGPDVPDLLTLDAPVFAGLLRTAIPRPSEGLPSKRVYLGRRPGQHRKLVNQAEVEAWFRDRGFQIVDPAEVGFAEQLDLMRDASMVVGPDGSAIFLAMFARPGTIVRTFSHPYLDDTEWFVALGAELGLDTAILVGELVERNDAYPLNSSYRVDLRQLERHFGALLQHS